MQNNVYYLFFKLFFSLLVLHINVYDSLFCCVLYCVYIYHLLYATFIPSFLFILCKFNIGIF